jgi:hypothetical protein
MLAIIPTLKTLNESKIIYILLIILFYITFLHSQESDKYLYLSPGFGRTYQENTDDPNFNSGLSLSMLYWPHLYSINFYSQYNFPSPEGNWENQEEFSFKYYHLFQPFGWQKFFIATGSGLALVNRRYKIIYVNDESSKDLKSKKLGIPLELRLGFLYPQRSLRLVDFALFKVFNSITNYYGWRLNFNISL